MACLFVHKWNGCKCAKCGKVRDKNHQYEKAANKCEEKCTVCGQVRTLQHTYERLGGKCEEICGSCGSVRPLLHTFNDGVCTNCGTLRSTLGTQEYVERTETFPGNNPDLVEYIMSVASEFSGKGDWQLLEPACKKYSETFSIFVNELSRADVLKGGYGIAGCRSLREYLHKKTANGNYNLAETMRIFNSTVDSVHPGVVYTFVMDKMKPIFDAINDENKLMLLPNMTSIEYCNKIVENIEKNKDVDKLIEMIYFSAIDYVRDIWVIT